MEVTKPIAVTDQALASLLENAVFTSITYRLFKFTSTSTPGTSTQSTPTLTVTNSKLEPHCEDYGQVAYYKGTISTHPFKYKLDTSHVFEKNRPVLVCGNTALMLQESWMKGHFTVLGNMDVHYGAFDCSVGSADAKWISASCC
jgi:hypothetical protein